MVPGSDSAFALRHCQSLGSFRLGRWAMTALAPHIAAFLHERLPVQQGASEHTRDSYSYAFQLLFTFAGEKLKMSPSSLQLEHLDAPLILSFLDNLESVRGNKAASRNVRLAAIKSFMRFLEHRVPSSLNKFTGLGPFLRRRPVCHSYVISRLLKREPCSMRRIRRPEVASEIAPCSSSPSLPA